MTIGIQLSVVIPVYNEEDNIAELVRRVTVSLQRLGTEYEVILVNDGSRDATEARLLDAASHDERIRVVSLRRNYGQTAAMSAGIDHARGAVIVPMDGDLQNDPDDIPLLLEELDKGYDVVSGWRRDRKDHGLRRNLPSRIANAIISRVSGVHLHDYGCTLKAYRTEVLKEVRLYGEMHRFIPIYAKWQGARVTEVPVRHHPRLHGVSKYGLDRTVKVLLDLMFVKFMQHYFTKPIYVFGGLGVLFLVLSFLVVAVMIGLRVFLGVSMISTPLPMLAAMAFITGVLNLLMGILAEMQVRTYFESQDKKTYQVKNLTKL